MAELWTQGVALPKVTVRAAARAEEEGWDGFNVVDSQNLAADPYVALALAAHATSTIKLGTAVTNPVTRHPAVTATSISTVHAESGGRAVLGIGRGDSALAFLGLAPAPVAVFERYIERLQGYLRGEDVPFDTEADGAGRIPPVSALGLASAPTASRIQWVRPELPKVPLDVAATGPKVIAAAARHAERITFAVGADPDRLRWAVGQARDAASGRPLSLGAYVNVVVHDDRDTGRKLISGSVASFARFSSMHGKATGPATDEQRQVFEGIHDAYDMHAHFRHGSAQSSVLTDAFIDRYGIAGPAGYCVDRLHELVDLGLDRLALVGGAAGADREALVATRDALVRHVLPALH